MAGDYNIMFGYTCAGNRKDQQDWAPSKQLDARARAGKKRRISSAYRYVCPLLPVATSCVCVCLQPAACVAGCAHTHTPRCLLR